MFQPQIHQISFGCRAPPTSAPLASAGGAYSAPPDPIAGLRGLLLGEGGRKGRRGGEEHPPVCFISPRSWGARIITECHHRKDSVDLRKSFRQHSCRKYFCVFRVFTEINATERLLILRNISVIYRSSHYIISVIIRKFSVQAVTVPLQFFP